MVLLIKIEKNTKDYDHIFLIKENEILLNKKDDKKDKNKDVDKDKDKKKINEKSKKILNENFSNINNSTNTNINKIYEKENSMFDNSSRNIINENNCNIKNEKLNFETISIISSKQNFERSLTNISLNPLDRFISFGNNNETNKEKEEKINLNNEINSIQTIKNFDLKSKIDSSPKRNTLSKLNIIFYDKINYIFN
jgi:hypothetical protein